MSKYHPPDSLDNINGKQEVENRVVYKKVRMPLKYLKAVALASDRHLLPGSVSVLFQEAIISLSQNLLRRKFLNLKQPYKGLGPAYQCFLNEQMLHLLWEHNIPEESPDCGVPHYFLHILNPVLQLSALF